VTTPSRLASEQHFHDAQAAGRASRFASARAFHFQDDDYLDHETWIRPAFDRLGDVAGLRVLDFGCGHGMAGVVLARKGAKVTAFDLSQGYLAEADRRARANGVRVHFLRCDGHALPFADASFDRVFPSLRVEGFQLLAMARRVLPRGRVTRALEWCDGHLLRRVPALSRYCRYVVLTMDRDSLDVKAQNLHT
jgi:ubiquinone/menaquinone biosynthesis C-methylase UbiE